MHFSYAVGLAAITYASQAIAFPEASDLATLEAAVPDVESFCAERIEDTAVAGLDADAVNAVCDAVFGDASDELVKRASTSCNGRHMSAVKKAHPKTYSTFCKKYTLKSKSKVKGLSSKQILAACKCINKAKVNKKPAASTCNTKQIAAVKKAHPKTYGTFCKKFTLKSKSKVKGLTSKQILAACKCINKAKKTTTKKTTAKTTKASAASTASGSSAAAATTSPSAAAPAAGSSTTTQATVGSGGQGRAIVTSSTVTQQATILTLAGGRVQTVPASTYVVTYTTTVYDANPTAQTSLIPTVSVPASASGSASVGGNADGGASVGTAVSLDPSVTSGILSNGNNAIPTTFTIATLPTDLASAVSAVPDATTLDSINSQLASITNSFGAEATAMASAIAAGDFAQASSIADQIHNQEAQATALVSQGSAALSSILAGLGATDLANSIIAAVPTPTDLLNSVVVPSVATSLPVSVPSVTVPAITAPSVPAVSVPTVTVTVAGISAGGVGIGL